MAQLGCMVWVAPVARVARRPLAAMVPIVWVLAGQVVVAGLRCQRLLPVLAARHALAQF